MKCVYLGFLAIVLLISGCATTPPVYSFLPDKDVITSQKSSMKIGVVSKKTPEISISLPGASCLLCIAVASAANSELSTHLKTLESDVSELDNILLEKLQSDGFNASIITEDFDFNNAKKLEFDKTQELAARRDFRAFGKQHNLTHIIVFDIYRHGATRNYSSYVATSPPYASISGNVYMIDLNTNLYVWNDDFAENITVPGSWKNPPNYPEVTNAYYSVIEKIKENILRAFDVKTTK